MYNSVSETRYREKDGYTVFITVPRNEFATIYDGQVNEASALDFTRNYLEFIGDDARTVDIKVNESNDSSLITIEAELSYINNGHTDYYELT